MGLLFCQVNNLLSQNVTRPPDSGPGSLLYHHLTIIGLFYWKIYVRMDVLYVRRTLEVAAKPNNGHISELILKLVSS